MSLKRWFRDEFGGPGIASQLIWTAILAGPGRAVTWLSGAQPKRELAYWLIVPALLLALVVVARKMLARPTLPQFDCHIEHMTFGAGEFTDGGKQHQGATVTVLAAVRNRGVASVASSYGLTLSLANGQVFTGTRASMPQTR